MESFARNHTKWNRFGWKLIKYSILYHYLQLNYVVMAEPPVAIDRIDVHNFQDVNTVQILLTPDSNPENINYSVYGGNSFKGVVLPSGDYW